MTSVRQAPPARQALLDTALAEIERDGMSVGLEHLSLERIIERSGVSRATAYRHWPNKAEFLSEVLVAAIRQTRLQGESEDDVAALWALVSAPDDLARLATSQGRRDVIVEGLRISAQADFDRIRRSPAWRTYLAISATCQGLPPGTLRDRVTAALAETDETFVQHRAEVYARIPATIGYRLTNPESDFVALSIAAGVVMTGLLVRAQARPDLADHTVRMAPFGSSREADWTTPAHLLVGNVLAHLEPDPDVVWDEARIDETLGRLAEIDALLVAQRAADQVVASRPAKSSSTG